MIQGGSALVVVALALVVSQAFAQGSDDAYSRNCAMCHGPEMRGGETGPTLIGSGFQQKWGAQLPGLEEIVRKTMPPTNPGSLNESDYAFVIARIRAANGWAPRVATSASASAGALTSAGAASAASGAATNAASPSASPSRSTRVEWLNNRGDAGSTSYSPLAQINRDNVSTLRIAWRWKTDNFGPTPEFYYRATPLMADGVLYTTAGIRRTVVAIDAATGETLWMYRLDEGVRGTSAPRRSSGRGVAYWRPAAPGASSSAPR
jgi:quinoprotein glucose dehydrogenase